ncbi:hypothetical protein ACIQCF_07295 [Streptomyces sp. NPDC088353]|uniref:hypothetical protein n=1 Tax=Streptomyces sp. NPDC088353 TaxID=3365855 RepID=UPI0038090CFC
MTTAAIRASLAARGIAFEPPYGCRWCGEERRFHGRRWSRIIGVHSWMEPDQAMIIERMRQRRAARLNPEPTLYHATTGWAADHTGESADPYCAAEKADGLRRALRDALGLHTP